MANIVNALLAQKDKKLKIFNKLRLLTFAKDLFNYIKGHVKFSKPKTLIEAVALANDAEKLFEHELNLRLKQFKNETRSTPLPDTQKSFKRDTCGLCGKPSHLKDYEIVNMEMFIILSIGSS
eukprot:NODE_294_length_10530_cov_0.245326.p6 type:complete len:122 gc:universal NODE_294_length_10530_cov_0.245326:5606-5971(+)